MAARKKKQKKNYTYAPGKRRSASARVRLFKGNEESTVNGIVIGKYFPGETMRVRWQMAFVLTETLGKYYITAKVKGGGKIGQLNAVVNGIARTFSDLDTKKYRSSLKKSGLLVRDSRIKERRMVGTGGRARKQKQSPKR